MQSFYATRCSNRAQQERNRCTSGIGAEGVYCNTSFIRKYGIPTYDIDRPIYPQNVDGTLNRQGAICHAAILRMGMGARHWENVEVAITNTG